MRTRAIQFSRSAKQVDQICSPEGRDCIEDKAGNDFNCSVSCEGMYADVFWVEHMLGEEEIRRQKRMELMGEIERKQEEANMMQIAKLVKEYNMFKKESVRHFRFSATANFSAFGDSLFSYQSNDRISLTPICFAG